MPRMADKGPKKLYSKPRIMVYGTVADLTKRVGPHGNSDGGHILQHTKTHA